MFNYGKQVLEGSLKGESDGKCEEYYVSIKTLISTYTQTLDC